MEHKYVKDFAIGLIVIAIIAFALKLTAEYRKVDAIPYQSAYSELTIDQSLLNQIQQIEESIQDRKQFVFTVRTDPLEQDLIVRTRVDLEAEWRREVEAMMRLAATYVDEFGNKKAAIAYQGQTNVYSIGETINGKTITEIDRRTISLREDNYTQELEVTSIPPKPRHLDERTREQEYIW